MSGDLGERVAALEAKLDGLEALLQATTRSYVDGRVASVEYDVRANAQDNETRIAQMEHDLNEALKIDSAEINTKLLKINKILVGEDGSNGLCSETRWTKQLHRIYHAITWGVLSLVVLHLFGVKLPFLP